MAKEVISTLLPAENLNDLAYIIFTSGSTGQPKGVMVSKKSYYKFVEVITSYIPYYHENTIFLSLLPFHFDGSFVDLYPTPLAGGTVVLMDNFILPNQLLDVIKKYSISFTCLTSSVLKLLGSRFSDIENYSLDTIEAIWYGTESCPIKIINQLQNYLPYTKFLQGYGPTEVTCTSHVYFIEALKDDDGGFYPIGKPLPTVNAVVLNDENKKVAQGEVGQLLLGGIQMMIGYCGDEQKTRNAFVYYEGQKYYKTGDYVTIDEAGNHILVGRKDDAIKYSGKLIYLSEIEIKFLKIDVIKDSLVLPVNEDGMVSHLVAFLILKENVEIDEAEIRNTLKKYLPEYMIPRDIIIVDGKIPTTSSGKLDKRKLLKLAYPDA